MVLQNVSWVISLVAFMFILGAVRVHIIISYVALADVFPSLSFLSNLTKND